MFDWKWPAWDLTKHHQDEEEGGHARRDVEHHPDVVSQLVHVVHVRNQDGGEQEADGAAQLRDTEQIQKHDSQNYNLLTQILQLTGCN